MHSSEFNGSIQGQLHTYESEWRHGSQWELEVRMKRYGNIEVSCDPTANLHFSSLKLDLVNYVRHACQGGVLKCSMY